MTELEQIKIGRFDFIKSLSFTFLPTQKTTTKN